jgi:hypothetical protein
MRQPVVAKDAPTDLQVAWPARSGKQQMVKDL